MPTQKLINAVISGVIKDERVVTRIGKYNITEYIGISPGARNRPFDEHGYFEHVYEHGGYESHNSFYGKPGTCWGEKEGFDTQEEAAIEIIRRRGIVAVDDRRRAIFRKQK